MSKEVCHALTEEYAEDLSLSMESLGHVSTVGDLKRALEGLLDSTPVAGLENLYNDKPLEFQPLHMLSLATTRGGRTALVVEFEPLEDEGDDI